jgi:uncharacterized membrane-anchored protein
MTTLDRLKLLAKQLLEREQYTDSELISFLESYSLTGSEEWTSENDDNIWLAYADFLEAYLVATIDYDQGEISEKIDRDAIAERIEEIRRRHTLAELKDIYNEGEETWF